MAVPTALLLLGLLAFAQDDPATEVDVAELLSKLADARRELDFGPTSERLIELGKRVQDEALARRLAAGAADFLAEASLFERLVARVNEQAGRGQPLPWPDGGELVVARADLAGVELAREGVAARKPWRSFAPALTLQLLAGLALAPAERVELARFAFWRGLGERGESELHGALEADPSLKDAADPMLAAARHEEAPRGGYSWHRGRFLPALEVNRRRLLEDAAQKSEQALGAEASLRLDEAIEAPARALDLLAPRLAAATQRIVAELAELYEPPRDWIASYRRNPSLRRQRLEQREQWEPVAKAALELIGKYDKPEQPEVDEFRSQLAEKALQYRRLRDADELAFERVAPRDAEALLARLDLLEPALEALLVYRREHHGDVVDPFPAVSPQGAKVHVLPGRAGSGLEEFARALLLFKSHRLLEFIQRGEELDRAGAELSPWERLVLRDHLDDALDLYNARLLTSADPEEYANVVATNEYRRTLLLKPFEIDERVVVAARGHSQEMKDLGYFGHDSPTDKLRTPSDRVRVAGYGGGAGENCYAGGGGGRGAFEGWYHSPGHHRGMVSGGPHLGVGADTTHSLWTQNFAGTDWGWRRWWPALTIDVESAVATAIARLGRTKHDTCRDELEALVELGLKALPASSRALTAARADLNAERRGFATRLARAIAVGAVQEGIPQASDLAIGTLLTLLDDPVGIVRGEANLALEHVTARSFGFGASLEPPQRAAAVKRWRDWWKAAREGFTPRIETRPEEIQPYDAASPAARGPGRRQSPDAPLKVFSPEERLALARRLGGSRQTEQAVAAAIDWLVRHQSPDGSWGARAFERQCQGARGEKCGNAGNFEFDVGLTGLALLCLIHGGSTVELGPHRDHVKKGLDFLVSRMQEHGKFTTTSGWYMYQHALATQALAEGYGTSGDPFLKQAAQKAVDFLVFAQNRELGGWRYEARTDCDTSVTGWVVLALATAHDARLRVAGFQGAREWIDRVTEPAYYRVGYTHALDGATHEPRLTAVGMVCRLALGTPSNHPALTVGKEWCLRQLPTANYVDLYFAYYTTLALFQLGGDPWKRWNDAMVPALLARIHDSKEGCRRGSFDSQGVYPEYGGRVYGTALSCLMLEVYYRYDKFPEVRSLSVTGSIADLAKPLVAKLGSGGTEVERAVAMRRLEEELGTSAQAPMLQLLRESKELTVRQDAADVLSHVATASILSDLLFLLDEPDGAIRERLHRAVVRAASPACIPDLVRRLADERSFVRFHAARTLGQLGRTEALAPLLERASVEPDGGVKSEITMAIRALANRSALDQLLDDAGFLATDPARRADLREGLRVLESSGLPEKLVAAKPKQPDLYAACLAPLKELGRAGFVPLLIAALELDDPEARTLADRLLVALAGRSMDFKPAADPKLRKEAIARWAAWWKSAREAFNAGSAAR